MQQQFADAFRRRNFVAGFFVGLDISVVKEGFAIFDSRECIADVRLACSDRFYLAPFQLDARFVALENVIIAERFAIDDRFSPHVQTPQAKCAEDSARYSVSWEQMLGSVRRFFERLVSQLASNNFLERNVGQRHPRGRLHQWSMSQAKLTYSLGNNINQKLLIRDHLSCFGKKLSRHMAQGTNGAGCFRWELKNDRHAVCKGGRDKSRGGHGKNER